MWSARLPRGRRAPALTVAAKDTGRNKRRRSPRVPATPPIFYSNPVSMSGDDKNLGAPASSWGGALLSSQSLPKTQDGIIRAAVATRIGDDANNFYLNPVSMSCGDKKCGAPASSWGGSLLPSQSLLKMLDGIIKGRRSPRVPATTPIIFIYPCKYEWR